MLDESQRISHAPPAERLQKNTSCGASALQEKLTDDGSVVWWSVGGSARERNICQASGKNLQMAATSEAVKQPGATVAEEEKQAGSHCCRWEERWRDSGIEEIGNMCLSCIFLFSLSKEAEDAEFGVFIPQSD